jgi:hypothetical protein
MFTARRKNRAINSFIPSGSRLWAMSPAVLPTSVIKEFDMSTTATHPAVPRLAKTSPPKPVRSAPALPALNSPALNSPALDSASSAPPISDPARSTTKPAGESAYGNQGLANDLERLRSEEQARIDRERLAELARIQELARFD